MYVPNVLLLNELHMVNKGKEITAYNYYSQQHIEKGSIRMIAAKRDMIVRSYTKSLERNHATPSFSRAFCFFLITLTLEDNGIDASIQKCSLTF